MQAANNKQDRYFACVKGQDWIPKAMLLLAILTLPPP